MRTAHPCPTLLAALVLGACSSPADRADDTGRTETAVAAAATPSVDAAAAANTADPTVALVVLYNEPKDTAAFERYYRDTHLPIVRRNAAEIGFTRAVYMKFDRTADGKKPAYYRKAELWFPSEEALSKGMATNGFKAVGADFANFITGGGPTIMISHQTDK